MAKRKRKPKKSPQPETIEEKALKFVNETDDPPACCIHCEARDIRTGHVQIEFPLQSIVQYLYCHACKLPVFTYLPVMVMPTQDDKKHRRPRVRPNA